MFSDREKEAVQLAELVISRFVIERFPSGWSICLNADIDGIAVELLDQHGSRHHQWSHTGVVEAAETAIEFTRDDDDD